MNITRVWVSFFIHTFLHTFYIKIIIQYCSTMKMCNFIVFQMTNENLQMKEDVWKGYISIACFRNGFTVDNCSWSSFCLLFSLFSQNGIKTHKKLSASRFVPLSSFFSPKYPNNFNLLYSVMTSEQLKGKSTLIWRRTNGVYFYASVRQPLMVPLDKPLHCLLKE